MNTLHLNDTSDAISSSAKSLAPKPPRLERVNAINNRGNGSAARTKRVRIHMQDEQLNEARARGGYHTNVRWP